MSIQKQRLLVGAMAWMAVSFGVSAQADTVLYPFCNASSCPDGEMPTGDLLRVGGGVNAVLFGTTWSGGAYNDGTVFSMTPCGSPPCTRSLVHAFGSVPNDGVQPNAGVISVGNTLYGTTTGGGQFGAGTVFSVQTNGLNYHILYSFCSSQQSGYPCTDGALPYGGLIDGGGGTLYGTTVWGGTGQGSFALCQSSGFGCGTVFEIQTNGTGFQVLHSFCTQTNCADGALPFAGVLEVNGTLYGTTAYGGVYGSNNGGNGTVFSVTPCGSPPCAEAVVYSFGANAPDGQNPYAALIYQTVGLVGRLYGTTANGGANGDGTVFAITPAGAETWLYSFTGGATDGAMPYADLLDLGPWLYGTTPFGGAGTSGTAFRIRRNGLINEGLINTFNNNPDGATPVGGLVRIGPKLFGTTELGGGTGSCSSGCGTVFSIP